MSIQAIHVHTQADGATVLFTKFMWETMISLANHPEFLQLTIHCMSESAAEQSSVWLKQGKSIVVPRSGQLRGSNGHAVCIMNALSINDGNIPIICDSDTVVVAKGWDDYIRKRIVNDEMGMIGTTYEDIGGFSSGTGVVQTYKKVPTFTWAALQCRHNWSDLNIMPNKKYRISIDSQTLSEIYNLPHGYSVFGEAAWQVPQYLYDKKLSYEGWKQLKPTKDAIVLKGLNDYHEEYHVNDIPFVVHHRGSMTHSYRSGGISKQFYDAVDSYLLSESVKTPHWTLNYTIFGVCLPRFNG